MDDMIEKALEKAMSKKTPVKQKKKSKGPDPRRWEKLFEENLRKEGYIK